MARRVKNMPRRQQKAVMAKLSPKAKKFISPKNQQEHRRRTTTKTSTGYSFFTGKTERI